MRRKLAAGRIAIIEQVPDIADACGLDRLYRKTEVYGKFSFEILRIKRLPRRVDEAQQQSQAQVERR